jgi:ABC-2 type transport system permease protein
MKPGSLGWLVRHELRLWSRDGRRIGWLGRAVVMLLLLLLPIAIGIRLAMAAQGAPEVPVRALGPLNAASFALVLLMVSGASIYVMRSFHDRGDLDLLLAAPIPMSRVMAAKSLAIHASVALPMLFLLSPFAIASAFLGHPGWLGGVAMIIICAVIATSLAFALVAALFRLLGPRRGRIAVQIGGGLFAAGVAIMAQVPNLAPERWSRIMRAVAAPPVPPFDMPARAALGGPLPLLLLAGLALVAAMVAAQIGARRLMDNGPAVPTPVARASKGGRRFRAGSPTALLTKELRLLWRDAELLSSVALQMAYMVPAFALIFSGGEISPGRLAAASVLFSGLLASSLGWLTICGDDAPDLIAAAPVAPGQALQMKVLAACIIPLGLVTVPISLTLVRDWRAGLIALLLCPVAASLAALQQHWAGQPQGRKAFRYRQKGSLLLAVTEYVMAGAWSATAGLLVAGSLWAGATAALAVMVLALSVWLFRGQTGQSYQLTPSRSVSAMAAGGPQLPAA